MRVAQINNYSYNANMQKQSFKHSAVPYPEYIDAYVWDEVGLQDRIMNVVSRISELFRSDVTDEASKIKSQINTIYDETNPKKQLLSVLA